MFQDRDTIRQIFIDAWKKRNQAVLLSPLEQKIVHIIAQHPEYHEILENSEEALTTDYATDNNPFLHLGLHLSIHEQLDTQRPAGINAIYQELCEHYQDSHHVEHLFAEAMANCLWEAQQQGKLPDENVYLEQLKKLS